MPKRGAFIVLIGLMAIGILIGVPTAAYQLTQPVGTPMGYLAFLDSVGNDAVDRIWQDGETLTVLMGGETFLVVVPDSTDLTGDLAAVSASHTGVGGVTIDTTVEQVAPVAPWFPVVVACILPLVLVAGLLVWARGVLRRYPPSGPSGIAVR